MRPMREQRWLCNKKLSSLSLLRGRSHVQQVILLNITVEKGSKDVVLVRGVASHCCGPGSIPGLGVRCGLSLLFAMVLAPQVFLRILQFSSLHKNKHSKFPFYLQTMNKGKPPCGQTTSSPSFSSKSVMRIRKEISEKKLTIACCGSCNFDFIARYSKRSPRHIKSKLELHRRANVNFFFR